MPDRTMKGSSDRRPGSRPGPPSVRGRLAAGALALLAVGSTPPVDAGTDAGSTRAFLRIETRDERGGLEGRCVAIGIAERWLLTAGHCLTDASTRLALLCPEGRPEGTALAGRVVRHPSHDAALVALEAPSRCLGRPPPLARSIGTRSRLSARALGVTGGDDASIPFVELARDAHVLRLDDPLGCLGRGDSGYPVLVTDAGGEATLAAMLIGGTETCPSLQTALRLDRLAGWIETTVGARGGRSPTEHDSEGDAGWSIGPSADDATDDCAPPGCLEIDTDARYCSLDPEQLPPEGPFATKSRLELAAGRYRSDADGRMTPPALVLRTPAATARLEPTGPGTVALRGAPDTNDPSAARLVLEARYASADGSVFELVLVAARRGGEARGASSGDRLFGLGERDAEAFLGRGQTLLLRARDPTTAFPELDRVAVAFAPCALPGREDERFVFALADGTRVSFVLRAAVGAHALGFYVGRVRGARVESAAGVTRVGDGDDLAFVGGSRQMGEPALPTLALRTAPRSDGDCGYLFDASRWDSTEARDGYVARALGCDGRPGTPLGLVSARYPDRYVLP